MSKFTLFGIISLVSGLFMLVFKAISSLTSITLAFPDLTLQDAMTPDNLAWLDGLSEGFFHTVAVSVASSPLYLVCIVIGVLLLLIGGILGK
ncbi:MAG: hypothetical protein KKD44_23585 [Proteobacteria bacterium]|nr:hypothetical protein [Pseudomonadota bacterium]